MGSPGTRHMFGHLSYEKSVDEIKEMIEKKIGAVEMKIAEREDRIVRLRKEFDITDQDMISLLSQAAQEAVSNRHVSTQSYSVHRATGTAAGQSETKVIAAGVVQNLLTERSLIEEEKQSLDRLRLIARNLRPIHHVTQQGHEWDQTHFTLGNEELEYLGF